MLFMDFHDQATANTAVWTRRKRRGPSRCNLFWLRRAPKVLKQIFYSGKELTTIQTYLWASIIGVIVALVVVAYQKALEGSEELVWHIIFNKLKEIGLFNERFKPYNYNWMVATVLGVFVGICLKIASKLDWLKTPGSMPDTIEKIHTRGYLSLNHFIPMFVTSVASITSGSSAGPESAVIVLSGSVAGYIARQLMQSRITTRILTLAGMSGGIAAFFGLPLGGALFVLEVPHRFGLQYFEALGPSIVCTIVSVIVAKSITQSDLGGQYSFPDIGTQTWFSLFQGLISGVLGAVAVYLFVLVAKGFKYLKKVTNLDPLLAGLIGGSLIGAIGVVCPYSMFPGENELQTILDRGKTPLPNAVHPGLITMGSPLTWLDYLTIALAKCLALGVTLGAGYPGGVIFPLFYLGAALGHAVSLLSGGRLPATISMLTMMASLESGVTRAPIGTCIIAMQIQASYSQSTHYMAVFPSLCVGVFVCMFLTHYAGFYEEQRDRDDILLYWNDPALQLNTTEQDPQVLDEEKGLLADEPEETDSDRR